MKPLKLSNYRLAKETGMSAVQVGEIIKGARNITAETALLISTFIGTTAELWLRLQADYDLRVAKQKLARRLVSIDTSFVARLAEEARV